MARRNSVVENAADALRRLISKKYAVGDQLPNEKVLAEQLEVSRGSMREALGTLVAEGVIVRRWGVGTFVSPPPSTSALSMSKIQSFRERVRSTGREVVLRDARCEKAAVPEDAAARLGVGVNTTVWRANRLFAVDGAPAALMREYLPVSIAGVAIDPSMMTDVEVGLFEMLDAHVPGVVAHTVSDVAAVQAMGESATALGLAAGLPVLRIDQTTSDATGSALVYGITLQRTDVLRMRITC